MNRSYNFSAGFVPPASMAGAPGRLRVLVLGTDALALAGLAALLSDDPDLLVTEQVLRGTAPEESARAVRLHHPDVILCDAGAAAPEPWLAEAAEQSPPLLALVETEEAAQAALRSGAQGALLRDAPPERLAAALRAAAEGLLVVDDALAGALSAAIAGPRHGEALSELPSEALTAREQQVLGLLAQGLSNRVIAERLGISEHTAKFHVNSILAKLDAQTRTDAVVRAARQGLILL